MAHPKLNGQKKVLARLSKLPKDWAVVHLEDIVDLRGRIGWKGLTTDDYVDEGPILIGVKNITRAQKLDLSDVSHIPQTKYLDSPEIMVRNGYLLLAKTGATIGKSCVVEGLDKEATVNAAVNVIECDKAQVDNYYLNHFFATRDCQSQMWSAASPGAQPNLFQKDINKLLINLPPLPEQQKIALILSTWDKAIEKTEQLIAQKQQLKKGLMQQLLTGKVRFKEFVKSKKMKQTKLGLVPEDWEVKMLETIGTIYTGGTPDTTEPKYWNGNINWYTPTEVTNSKKFIGESERKISLEGLKNSSAKLFPAGTIVVCTRATIGEIAISKVEACTNQGFKSLFPKQNADVDYLYYQLIFRKNEFVRKSAGSTFLELATSDFRSFEIPMPSKPEQKKIGSTLTSIDEMLLSLELRMIDLKNQKKGLMQKLLTGELRVKTK